MGCHYNPQRLMRNFEDPNMPGYVWLHDKRKDHPISTAIKCVAQERDFYDPETEKLLNTQIEIPGGNAIDKIFRTDPLTTEDQFALAIHIGVMLQRTPAHRIWVKELSKDIIPGAMESVRQHGLAFVRQITSAGLRSDEWAKSWLTQMELSMQRLDGKASDVAIERMNNPFPSQTIVAALIDMTWRIVESTGPQLFLTSDNPAVYFRAEGYGLGGPETEVVMPISTRLALHGSRNRKHPSFSRMTVNQRPVREFNKMLCSSSREKSARFTRRMSGVRVSHRPLKVLLNQIHSRCSSPAPAAAIIMAATPGQ
jgi:hypothetical protein